MIMALELCCCLGILPKRHTQIKNPLLNPAVVEKKDKWQ
jgi:hypothetical protein